MNSIISSVRRNSLILGAFSIITVGLVSLTYVLTKDRIAQQIEAFEVRALHQIISPESHDNDLLKSTTLIDDKEHLALPQARKAYIALAQGLPYAVILPVVAPDGYNGRINMLVGVFSDGRIAGVRVITHKETPGLGDSIDTKVSDWIKSLDGHSLQSKTSEQWAVKKDGGDFDQFTGATITPRAVVSASHRALLYFAEHKDSLFAAGIASLEMNTAGDQ